MFDLTKQSSPAAYRTMKKIIVLGIHNSGSTLLCRMMHHLRVNFGELHGHNWYGSSYEQVWIGNIMSRSMSFGQPPDWERIAECQNDLTKRINMFFQQWAGLDSAIKHPFLCAGMTVLDDEVLAGFSFVHCTRPLENSIKGAKAAYPQLAEGMTEYQNALHEGKNSIIARAQKLGCNIFDWNYDAMETNGRELVENLAQWLDTGATKVNIEQALSLFDERMHHFGGLVERPLLNRDNIEYPAM